MIGIFSKPSIIHSKDSIRNLNVVSTSIMDMHSILSINKSAADHSGVVNSGVASASAVVNSLSGVQGNTNVNTAANVSGNAGVGNTSGISATSPIMQTSPAIQAPTGNVPVIHDMILPPLVCGIQKGQKVVLDPTNTVKKIDVCLGWNVLNPHCDVDVSAFILGADNKVLGDDWFVFYGQEYSPDKNIHFFIPEKDDRECIHLDLDKLNPNVNKIVFVLTINEALEKKLNFSMVKDAYIRILNSETKKELCSFKMTDYYSNVISMMIGEIYLNKGVWKCNAIGNGVVRDLAGLCELYGVQVV